MNKADAIRYFGSPSRLAQALGISRQAVAQWPDVVPLGRAYQIYVLTRGELALDERTDHPLPDNSTGVAPDAINS